ncbi:FtsK/SpoIIIE domain-containing protein [Streptomyces erythrochromogenes]|uniref:FtsK/SpoIIIE domain-containing protein n=1 Tax=Streptomyces erythrochromogenes TaxID=285574 RepID=UPI00367D225E
MGKKRKSDSREPDDLYAHSAGAIGVLVMVFGGLTAIKVRLGLPWPAAVALTVGALIALGYGAWWVKSRVVRWWAGKPADKPAAALAQDSPAGPAEGGDAAAAAHQELTTVMVTAGAIGREQVIRADETTVKDVRTGTHYDFLVPEGRTYEHVEKQLSTVAGMFRVSRLHLKLERSRDNERRVHLLKLHAPPFTHPFPAPDRQQIEAFGGIPLGHDVTGTLAGVPALDKASLLVGGMTQMGKTTLINGIITCLLIAYGEFELYLLDGKFCGLTRFENVATRYESSDDPAVFEAMVDELNNRSDARYAEIKDAVRARKPAPKFKPVIFIVDEAADFFASDETKEGKEQARRIAEKTRSLVAKSLESGISSVLLTQRPAQNAIPVMVRDQFLIRMCLYVASTGTAKVALGDTYFETVAPVNPVLLDPDIKGQAVLFANGRSTLIRGFNFSDEFIWGVVDGVQARQQKALEKAPDTPLTQAIGILRSKGVEFMSTADLAPAVGITDTRPVPRGQALSKLLGVAPGKDAKGVVRGYWLAELTAAAKASQ